MWHSNDATSPIKHLSVISAHCIMFILWLSVIPFNGKDPFLLLKAKQQVYPIELENTKTKRTENHVRTNHTWQVNKYSATCQLRKHAVATSHGINRKVEKPITGGRGTKRSTVHIQHYTHKKPMYPCSSRLSSYNVKACCVNLHLNSSRWMLLSYKERHWNGAILWADTVQASSNCSVHVSHQSCTHTYLCQIDHNYVLWWVS